jgi:hypothetical protein
MKIGDKVFNDGELVEIIDISKYLDKTIYLVDAGYARWWADEDELDPK